MPFRFRRSFRIVPGIRLNVGRRSVFRFRYSILLAPGIWLNIGRRGLSTSLGAHITVGRNIGAMVSAPGTGLSNTATTYRRSAHVVTVVVIWSAQLLGVAIVLVLLFSWAAGWL